MDVPSKQPRVAARIVAGIVNDLSDRRGLSQEFENIDDDIRREIISAWINIVESHLEE